MDEYRTSGKISIAVKNHLTANTIASSVDPENSLLTKIKMKTQASDNKVVTVWEGSSSIWTLKNTLDDLIASIILASETVEVIQEDASDNGEES